MDVEVVKTTAYADQKAGTSGLRKRVTVFQQPHYLENFIQSIFDCLPESDYKDKTWLVAGDGRYFSDVAIQKICEIAAANGVSRMWIGEKGLASTPACSCILREREGGVCQGAIILTASHNPGGADGDFGVKLNMANGGPATEAVTNKIFEHSKQLKEYKKVKLPTVEYTKAGKKELIPGKFTVEVIDAVEDWMKLMKTIFDFDMIKKLLQRKDFKMLYDGMHGVGGPYAKKLLCEELGGPSDLLLRCDPKPDFGGHHPDPNLTYAKTLVDLLHVNTPEKATEKTPQFGAAGDGDCDRNMILGRGFFVVPSDSVAVIAAFAPKCIPYFTKGGVKGVARSMPTSYSLNVVAEAEKIDCYETPTGWKFFGNLMDAGKINICGEESFGTSSDHIREKDGLWAVLCWLSILAHHNKSGEGKFVGVGEIMEAFWKKYGRNYYIRHDYEEVDSEKAKAVMDGVLELGKDVTKIAEKRPQIKELLAANPIKKIDNFEYTDPVDKSVSGNQGIRVHFQDGSRVIFRISGTGSVGATIRIYFDRYTKTEVGKPADEILGKFAEIALGLSEIKKITGREKPDVMT